MGRGPKPAKGKAKPPVSRKSPNNEGARVRDLEKRLAESLEQQAATAEILRVISGSRTDIQSVLDAVAENAARLCHVDDVSIIQADGGSFRVLAYRGAPRLKEFEGTPVTRGSVAGRAILDGRVVHVPDVTEMSDAEFSVSKALVEHFGHSTMLATPLLREGKSIGAIFVRRTKLRPFSDREIQLLQTFADQAVIAIENVRLFTELQEKNTALTQAHAQVTESLEQQTATSDILRVISRSQMDVHPVFDAIAASALRLCSAFTSVVYRFDGELIHVVSREGHESQEAREFLRRYYPIPPNRGGATARSLLTRNVVYIRDVREDLDYRLLDQAAAVGFRSILSVPMLREGDPIGAITLSGENADAFSGSQVALLKTFADQAVIAIENVRLFTELQTSNRELTTALDKQTATSDILRVISRSRTDVQPVFEAVARSAARLCEAYDAVILLKDEDSLVVRKHYGPLPRTGEGRHPINRRWVSGRAVLDCQPVHVHDVDAAGDEFPEGRAVALRAGNRTTLGVPLLRDGSAIGVILIRRTEVRPFSDEQIALLQTFADQAVIAIENVRLFTETKEALERQTATAQILGVISSSLTDVQPVFDAIAESAARLCAAYDAVIFQLDGDVLRRAAHTGSIPAPAGFAIPATRSRVTGRALLDRLPVHVADAQVKSEEFPETRAFALEHGFRTILSVPLLREGVAIGTIDLRRTELQPFTEPQIALLQTFADQAVIAIENVRLFKELEQKNQALTQAHAQVIEALDQQTATSEILRVISQSPTDVQPVFEAIVASAVRLLGADTALMTRVVGDHLEVAAITSTDEADHAAARVDFPLPLHSASPHARAVRDRAPFNSADARTDPRVPEGVRAFARRHGHKRIVVVPLLRDQAAIGTLALSRREGGGFTADEIPLLQTFADQAVIAIENVRLFTETKEALERQTATSEILRVISSSPTDIQPVLDAVAENAARVCGADDALIFRVEDDVTRRVAHHGSIPASADVERTLTRDSVWGRSVVDRRTVHVPDIEAEAGEAFADSQPLARQSGARTHLATPLMRQGAVIGAILIRRLEVRPFTASHIALLQTFADQAVIAIENVRLFTELQEKNRALTQAHAEVTETLEQQTATADILRTISTSPSDVRPVLDAVVRAAARFCDAPNVMLSYPDGNILRLVAGVGPFFEEAARRAGGLEQVVVPIDRGSVFGRSAVERRTIHVADLAAEPEDEYPTGRALQQRFGHRTMMSTPLLKEGTTVGVIGLFRYEVRPFSDKQISRLAAFADQAVIAIENVRLFKELEARTAELTRSVGQLTALGEVGRAVSSTLDLETVLSTIVSRAIQLSGTDGGSVYEYDEATEEFSLRASRDLPDAYVEEVRDTRPRKGEGAVGRVAQTREPVQIVDISDATAYESRVRNILLQMGLRALLAVPLIAEGHLVGALIVMRKRTGSFADEEVALLQTFATQSALAIQNARLFREIEDKSRQLEVASQHKSEFLANMSHELRTPLNAIIGFSEVLAEKMFGELNEKQEEYSKDIHASGQHLLSLINDILDLSKIEAGRMELELSDFHLPTALDSALTLVRERAGRRGIALQINVDERLGQLRADERKVRQVVLNLLSNAIKFTPEGGRIAVAAVPRDGSVEVSVSDNGVGIAPEDQERVFEEFRQVGTADKKAEGTGLGLTLCRKFVELHGGRIWVKSQVGQGSVFTFTLPAIE